jgi:hypothetical protein
MKILLLGNCQMQGISRAINLLLGDDIATAVRANAMSSIIFGENNVRILDPDINELIWTSDFIVIHAENHAKYLTKQFPDIHKKISLIPSINYSGYHPDMIHIDNGLTQKKILGPLANCHSSIALWAWYHDLSIDQAIELYTESVYEGLGFFEYYQISRKSLIRRAEQIDFYLKDLIDSWSSKGCWMYAIHHPKLFVLIDLAKYFLEKKSIPYKFNSLKNIHDDLAILPIFPVYPEIGKALGIDGDYLFKPVGEKPTNYNLEEFVRASFECYSHYSKDGLVCERLNTYRYKNIKKYLRNKKLIFSLNKTNPTIIENVTARQKNPYKNLPHYQFWRRAVGEVPMGEVDPIIHSSFSVSKTDKVATGGSCFAQHIARRLQQEGFNYYITEKGTGLTTEESLQRNYGVFSARYGNIYTTRQLLQLFDRAYENFIPKETYWKINDERYADPFRPQIEPEGFSSLEMLKSSRDEHFKFVREMFENLDVFVFTFGLTEAWRNRCDGAIYPLAPGVVAGEMDPEKHEFVNFNLSEVVIDMQSFIDRLLKVNSQARLILTVSPVPLIATYEDRHVLVSNTYSKSVLRVAAEEICERNPVCEYFPSYEIIAGNYTKSEYYEEDLRSIKTRGVGHVMRLFMSHYSTKSTVNSLEEDLMEEGLRLSKEICDEEAIEESLN